MRRQPRDRHFSDHSVKLPAEKPSEDDDLESEGRRGSEPKSERIRSHRTKRDSGLSISGRDEGSSELGPLPGHSRYTNNEGDGHQSLNGSKTTDNVEDVNPTQRRVRGRRAQPQTEDANLSPTNSDLEVLEDTRNISAGGGGTMTVKSPKSKQSRKTRKPRTSSSKPTISGAMSSAQGSVLNYHSDLELETFEDFENMQFVNIKDLPSLPRIESDQRGHFLGSNHKFERPISGFRVRVRLLKYPSISEKVKWPGDLAVLEDRVLYWQEKVFSKWEADKYSEKKSLKSDLDHQYYKEIEDNPSSVGLFLHTYIDSDYFIMKQSRKTLIRKCAGLHPKSSRLIGTSLDSDGWNEFEDDTEHDSTSQFQAQPSVSSRKPIFTTTRKANLSEQEQQKFAERQKKEEEERQKQVERLESLREIEIQKQEEKERQALLKLSRKQIELAEKQDKMDQLLRQEHESKEALLNKFSRSKRPTAPISATLFSSHISPTGSTATEKKSRKSSKGFPLSESGDGDTENDRASKSAKDSLDDDGVYEKLVKPGGQKRQRPRSTSKPELPMKLPVVVRHTRPLWRLGISGRNRFVDRAALQPPPQSMFIMASVPHTNRRRKEIVVCSIKAYPSSGVVALKPPFGYRIIEAKRNHVYRLSWELYCPESSTPLKGDRSKFRKFLPPIQTSEQASATRKQRDFQDMGVSFELAPMNEMRLFVMGEIISAHGFESEPLCVHYLVEIPKGWKNDSITSALEGTTHSSYTTDDTTAHFSHDFGFQLAFSMDSVQDQDFYSQPVILFMVVSMKDSGRVRYEGYGYISVPSTPGPHVIKVQTWRLKPRSITEKMQNLFLDATPSLQDIHAAHIPLLDQSETKLANRLGLHTETSGSVKLRLNVIHQTTTAFRDQASKLDLLEKMSSATILKSVQAVIEAFNRARNKALLVKNNSVRKDIN